MEAKVRKKSDSDGQERVSHSKPKQYTRNLQRIFHNESNFKFRHLEDFDEDKELISPTESEQEDLLGLGNLECVSFVTDTRWASISLLKYFHEQWNAYDVWRHDPMSIKLRGAV